MWILCNQGMEVLRSIYDTYRKKFHEDYPGSNENDCERAFLSEIADRTHYTRTTQQSSDIKQAIEKIA